MNNDKPRSGLTDAQRHAMRRRGEQLKTAGSLLGALFFGTSREQREALNTIAEDVDDQVHSRRRGDDDAIVVHGEPASDEPDDEDEDP
jgi:hypothetical protein